MRPSFPNAILVQFWYAFWYEVNILHRFWGEDKEKVLKSCDFRTFSGGDKRDRTADLLNAIQALSQLSYTPMEVLFTLSGEVSLARCLIIIAELGGFVKKNFRVFLLSRRTWRPPGYMAVYFRNPATICSSACSSVRPRVMSLMIWSPAILPMAASWTRLASTLLAVISGMAWT